MREKYRKRLTLGNETGAKLGTCARARRKSGPWRQLNQALNQIVMKAKKKLTRGYNGLEQNRAPASAKRGNKKKPTSQATERSKQNAREGEKNRTVTTTKFNAYFKRGKIYREQT